MLLSDEERELLEPEHFTTIDPFGTHVTCSKITWQRHILPGHPEMLGREQEVQRTVKDPDKIFTSSSTHERNIYFKSTGRKTSKGEMYNKVVTAPVVPGVHRVVSAWQQVGIKGGIANVKYEKPED